jgi:hypothetical protein
MTLQDIIADIHALTEDVEVYERKYGILSETFYELYIGGAEPDNDTWVLDWSDWAGAYKILLRRKEQYRNTMQVLQTEEEALSNIVIKTAQKDCLRSIATRWDSSPSN